MHIQAKKQNQPPPSKTKVIQITDSIVGTLLIVGFSLIWKLKISPYDILSLSLLSPTLPLVILIFYICFQSSAHLKSLSSIANASFNKNSCSEFDDFGILSPVNSEIFSPAATPKRNSSRFSIGDSKCLTTFRLVGGSTN